MQILSTEWILIALAIIGSAIQGYTLLIMRNRKMLADFPVFFRYSAFCAMASAQVDAVTTIMAANTTFEGSRW